MNHIPTAYGYARVSTDEQELEAQHNSIETYFQNHLMGTHKWGGIFSDLGVSAYEMPMLERPEGRKLWQSLGLGDSLIITRIDRAFRQVADSGYTAKLLKHKSVSLHTADGGLVANDPSGTFAMEVTVAASELSSALTSRRTQETMTAHRLKGEAVCHIAPPGYKRVLTGEVRKSGKPIRMLVPHERERLVIDWVADEFTKGRGTEAMGRELDYAGVKRWEGGVYSVHFLCLALHCRILNWPTAWTERAYKKYRREARDLGYVDGPNNRARLLASLAFLQTQVDLGHDFSKPKLGFPHIPMYASSSTA